MRRGKILLFSIMTLILLVGAGCSNSSDNKSQEDQAVPVMVKQVQVKNTQSQERYIGSIKANQDIMVLPKIAGKVQEILVKQGELVKKDQLLMKIDDTNYADSLRQAEAAYQSSLSNLEQAKQGKGSSILQTEAQLQQAQDSFDQAKKNLDRTTELFKANAVAKTQLEQAQTAYLQAENGVKIAQDAAEKAKSDANIKALESTIDQAKIAVDQARRTIEDTRIKAPFAGQVASIMVDEGEMAGPQSPVTQVVNQDRMMVQLNITESSLRNFKEGDSLTIKVPSIDKSYDGEVTFIAPAANAQTLTFLVEIAINKMDQSLRSGMLVEVDVIKSIEQNQLVIPTQAILGEGKDTYVFILKEDKAVKQNISIKEMSSNETVIQSGLTKDNQVLTEGQYSVKDGSPVKVIKEEGKAS